MSKHITKFTIKGKYEPKEIKNIKMFMTPNGETVELPYETLTVDYIDTGVIYNPSEVRFSIDEMEDIPF